MTNRQARNELSSFNQRRDQVRKEWSPLEQERRKKLASVAQVALLERVLAAQHHLAIA